MTLPIVTRIREIARLHGWGIGEHGTMVRDIDLIGVPWTEEASSLEVLVDCIARIIGYPQVGSPTRKPCGRVAVFLLHPDATAHDGRLRHNNWVTGCLKGSYDPPAIDLSLIDPRRVVLNNDPHWSMG